MYNGLIWWIFKGSWMFISRMMFFSWVYISMQSRGCHEKAMTIVKKLSTKETSFLIYITVLWPMIYANKTNFNLHCCHAFLLGILTGATVNKEIEMFKMDGNVNKNKLTVFWLSTKSIFLQVHIWVTPKTYFFCVPFFQKSAIGLPDH